MYKILLTCPPMIGALNFFDADFKEAQFDVTVPDFRQEMSEQALCDIIADFDGWIIGDDPATYKVVEAGVKGKLKACMRWGVGTNNVDFNAFRHFSIPVEHTPGVFGQEVADIAMNYVTSLIRHTYKIDQEVKNNNWFKPIGRSLWSCNAFIVGMGDIGRNLCKRLEAHGVSVSYYDPNVEEVDFIYGTPSKVEFLEGLKHTDFVIFTAPLNSETHHMFNFEALNNCKEGIKLINVGRGPLVDERALLAGLSDGTIEAAALDVFEVEPYSSKSHADFTDHLDKLILGSHNGSNTIEAVQKVSRTCIRKLKGFLEEDTSSREWK